MNIKELATEALERIKVLDDLFYRKELSPEEKYRIIYKIWNTILYPIFHDLSLDCDFYDPDTSYEEDTQALLDMLKDSIPKLKLLQEIF